MSAFFMTLLLTNSDRSNDHNTRVSDIFPWQE